MSMASQVDVVELQLEIGHEAIPKPYIDNDNGFTHNWKLFVRGVNNDCLHLCVEKVIFFLHDSFRKPKRVLKEPPYEIQESGYAGFELQIEVHFKNKEVPKKITFDYDLVIELHKPVARTKLEKLTFQNPHPDFKKKLIKGGAIVRDSKLDGSTVVAASTPASESKCDIFSATLSNDKSALNNANNNTIAALSAADSRPFNTSSLSSPSNKSSTKKDNSKSSLVPTSRKQKVEKVPKNKASKSAKVSNTGNGQSSMSLLMNTGNQHDNVGSQFSDLFKSSTVDGPLPTPTPTQQLVTVNALSPLAASGKSKNIAKLSSKSSSTGSKNSAKADKEYNGYFQSQQQYEHQEQFKAPSPLGSTSTAGGTFSASIRASQSNKSEQTVRATKLSSKSHERSDSSCSTRSTSKEIRKEKLSHKESNKCKQNVDISASSGKKDKDKRSKSDSKRDRSATGRSSSTKEKKRKRKKSESSSSSSSDSSSSDSSDSDDSAGDYTSTKYSKSTANKPAGSSKRQRLNSASSTSSLAASSTPAGQSNHPTAGHPVRSIMYGKDDNSSPFVAGERSKHKTFAETMSGHIFPGLINNRIPKIKRDTSQSPLPLPSPQFSDDDKLRANAGDVVKKESTKKNTKVSKDVRNNSGGTETSQLLSTKIKYQDEKTVTTIEIKEFNKKKTWDSSNESKVLKKEKESSKSSSKVPAGSSKGSRNRKRSSSLELDDSGKSSRKSKSSKHSKYQQADGEHNRKAKSDRANRNDSVDVPSKSKSSKKQQQQQQQQRDLPSLQLPTSTAAMILLDKKSMTSSKFVPDSGAHSQPANSYVDLSSKIAQNVAFTAEHHAAHFRNNAKIQRQLSDDDDKMSVSSASTSNSSRSSSSMSSASSMFIVPSSSSKRIKSKSKSDNGRKSHKEHKKRDSSLDSKRKHSKKSKKYEKPISDSESEHEDSESKFVAKRATSDSDDDSLVNFKQSKWLESGNRNSINGTSTKPPNAGFTGLSDSDSEMSESGMNTVIKSPPTVKHSKSSKKSKKHSSKSKHVYDSDMSQSDDSDAEDDDTPGSVQSAAIHHQGVAHHKPDSAVSGVKGQQQQQQLVLPGSVRSPIDRAALSSGYGTDRLSVSPAQSAFNTGAPSSSPQIKQSYSLDYSELHVRLCRINDSKKLQKVMDLIDERNFECLQIVDNRVEFDLKKLDHATLVEIRRLVC